MGGSYLDPRLSKIKKLNIIGIYVKNYVQKNWSKKILIYAHANFGDFRFLTRVTSEFSNGCIFLPVTRCKKKIQTEKKVLELIFHNQPILRLYLDPFMPRNRRENGYSDDFLAVFAIFCVGGTSGTKTFFRKMIS